MQTFKVDFRRFWLSLLAPSSAVAMLAISLIGLSAWANPLFVGLSGVETHAADNNSTTQVIEFRADLPFHYQMQILDKNRVVFRLYNVNLASNLLTLDGKINLLSSGTIQSATIRPVSKHSHTQESYQEIVFQGPGLGDQKIQVVGATELPMKLAKLSSAPVILAPVSKPIAATASQSKPKATSTPAPVINAKLEKHGKRPIPPLQPAKFSSRGASVSLPNLSILEKSASQKPATFDASENQQANAMMALSVENEKTQTHISQPSKLNQRIAIEPEQSLVRPLPAASELATQPSIVKTSSQLATQAVQSRTRTEEKGPQIESQMRMPANAVLPAATMPQATTSPAVSVTEATEQNFEPEQTVPSAEAVKPLPSEPVHQMMIPLPRYQGGAPPIQAVTLDSNGTPVRLRPKNEPIQELMVGKANGGFNTLFQAETPELTQPRTIDHLMTESLSLFHEKKYSKAGELIDEALKMEPANADLYAALAEVQLQLGQSEPAIHAYQRASQLAPKQYGQVYAQVLIQLGKRQEALQVLTGLNQQQPQQAQIVYMLGTLYEELGQVNEALTYLKQAAQLHPASADIQYNLGLAYELAGDHERAEKHYRHALNLSPTATDAAKALERVRN